MNKIQHAIVPHSQTVQRRIIMPPEEADVRPGPPAERVVREQGQLRSDTPRGIPREPLELAQRGSREGDLTFCQEGRTPPFRGRGAPAGTTCEPRRYRYASA